MSSGDFSMVDLFRSEVETQIRVITERLMDLEALPDAEAVTAMMRAAHTIKGAARMVDLEPVVQLAHALEDRLVTLQNGSRPLDPEAVDALLAASDLILQLATDAEDAAPIEAAADEVAARIADLSAPADQPSEAATAPAPPAGTPAKAAETESAPKAAEPEVARPDATLLELFRNEAEAQIAIISQGLLGLEANPGDLSDAEALMRAAHSLKGAARMLKLDALVALTHAMEDVFVAAQGGSIVIEGDVVDLLLAATDLVGGVTRTADIPAWCRQHAEAMLTLGRQLADVAAGKGPAAPPPPPAPAPETAADHTGTAESAAAPTATPPSGSGAVTENAIRISADSLNRLMGLAGEVQVEARWVRPFTESLLNVKYRQTELVALLDRLRDRLEEETSSEYLLELLNDARRRAGDCRRQLAERLGELDEFDRRSHNLASRLNREVIASRMRPFGDGVHGFRRMVRDLARQLGKQVRFEIEGLNTRVDREILEKIEAPLNHILRNALDHGIETPEERRAAGKPEQATLRLEALHSAGMLSIMVSDDGRGMDLEELRARIVRKKLVSEEMARDLTEAELMEFIFLPGFSTRDSVTEISGRGVGLDVVHSVVQEMHGIVHATSRPGQGMRFHLQLPLTLSVMRTLMVEIAGEPYAFPLGQINRTLKLDRGQIETMEGRQYFTLGNQHVGLLPANQLLGLPESPPESDEVCVVVLGERLERYGFAVDRFLGERSLVVHPLDARLGKVQDIAAASILENGDPCLILDVDDMLRSADILAAGGRIDKLGQTPARFSSRKGKRILVVDDSITVREVERNMLANRGYEVEVAVDGMDGWNAVRTGEYDLVISDIDMPRMNGFEFVSLIKQDPLLKKLPVMIVSYKDREEDRRRGLEVGADYYLTKGSFHDETLLEAVADLIGDA